LRTESERRDSDGSAESSDVTGLTVEAEQVARMLRMFEGDYNYPPGLLLRAAALIDALTSVHQKRSRQ